MNFKRPILILLFLCLLLGAGLVATHVLRPRLDYRLGERLFTLPVESVTTMECDVLDETGQWCTAKLERQGIRWVFSSPYAGTYCSETAMNHIFEATRQMRVTSVIGRVQETNFNAQQYLTLKTIDKTLSCGFNRDSELSLEQTAVAIDNELVTIASETLASLPKQLNDLRSCALLPFTSSTAITEITWSEAEMPFTRAHRLPDGDWEVSQADLFKKRKEVIDPILEHLVSSKIIAQYIFPSTPQEASTTERIPTEMLMKYGLDMENARLSIRTRDLDKPLIFSLGNSVPENPDYIYCLIHASQSIVLIPQSIRAAFAPEGPFAVDYTNLPLLETDETPNILDIRLFSNDTRATYMRNGQQWENKLLGLTVDKAALDEFLDTLVALHADLLAIQQPEMTDPYLQISLQYSSEAKTTTLAFAREETGDILVHCKETGRLYTLPEDVFPEKLYSPTLPYDLLDKTALRLNPSSITKITLQRPKQPDIAIARDASVTQGWRTLSPQGAYVNVEVVNAWLNHFSHMPAHALSVLQNHTNTLAPWGYRADGEIAYQLRVTLDFDGTNEHLRNTLLFAESARDDAFTPMILQGRLIEYLIAPDILQSLLQNPLLYEDRE